MNEHDFLEVMQSRKRFLWSFFALAFSFLLFRLDVELAVFWFAVIHLTCLCVFIYYLVDAIIIAGNHKYFPRAFVTGLFAMGSLGILGYSFYGIVHFFEG